MRLLILALFTFSVAHADVVEILNNGQSSAQYKYDLIRSAKSEIVAEYFEIGSDEASKAFLALLRREATRGLKVRLILDAISNRAPKEMLVRLLEAGVEIKEFHRGLHHPLKRSHEKLLLADQMEMITGGRNVYDSYYGLADGKTIRNYVDRDVYVRGSAVKEAYDHFNDMWNSDEVQSANIGIYSEDYRNMNCEQRSGEGRDRCFEIRTKARTKYEQAVPELDGTLLEFAKKKFVDMQTTYEKDGLVDNPDLSVTFLHDTPGQKSKNSGIGKRIAEEFDKAKVSIEIESPFLTLSDRIKDCLNRAVARGVKVRILTNSLASTSDISQSGFMRVNEEIVNHHIELWEMKGPEEELHAKTFVIDGKTVIIGSYNLDNRSEHLNMEVGVLFTNAELAKIVTDSMTEHLMTKACLIDSSGEDTVIPGCLPKVKASKRFWFKIFEVLTAPINGQL